MVPELLNSAVSWTRTEEEGVIYFLLLPHFEKHKTFFVFTGRQVLSRDLGHRSELEEVERIIEGFELNLRRQDSVRDDAASQNNTGRVPMTE